ncbi:Tom22p KNAG_0I02240 [Huiozyma naganishii CBS 8797]|uniref:Mitochondrial import receptor subunit TOM22 n=1 Tax=Huiozyma naganishii (strain ATCC MYA-139 / BCRC 22969 / CBS 8797 / KCTC 17520 / NBRC 10181 / NCYC 3082 / Yp74L-3) TaxID=1071383 RepID=J7RAX3_HUIN7|nr:hypothetical protein KNAG_0I02240 [Kazachstania naganishii CBS 8797]CCK72010.1 hypothetical protein KNAG_0I02240 [Kazachstania naganishii CBS 8797]
MVELTEIKDEATAQEPRAVSPEPVNASNEKELFKHDGESEDDSDFEDDFDENETLLERICALREIIPPRQRARIARFYDCTASFMRTAFQKGGNLTWAITTSALLLGVPLSLSILSEQQLIEMEKTFDLQKDANDILTQGGADRTEQKALA